jgi:hypothetical protein
MKDKSKKKRRRRRKMTVKNISLYSHMKYLTLLCSLKNKR